MSKTSASAVAAALLGAALAAQPALAQDVSVDVRVQVQTDDYAPASRRVCNDFTCWTEGGRPRYRKVDETVERYRRTTVERN